MTDEQMEPTFVHMTTPPTEEGWYWVKLEASVPWVVRIEKDPIKPSGFVITQGAEGHWDYCKLAEKATRWSPAIYPPPKSDNKQFVATVDSPTGRIDFVDDLMPYVFNNPCAIRLFVQFVASLMHRGPWYQERDKYPMCVRCAALHLINLIKAEKKNKND